MLASKTRKLYKLRSKNKESVSVDDLAILVKRLSVQVDDLEHWVTESNQKTPEPDLTTSNNSDPLILAPHHTIDPWASDVPPNYGALLHRLEDIKVLQNCPNSCCSSTATVNCVQGIPWPEPAPPFSGCFSNESADDILDVQYTHWCTLMRCLPLMDPVATSYVKTMGLYAMKDILAVKMAQKNSSEALSPKSAITNSFSSKLEDDHFRDEAFTENTTPTDSVEMLNDEKYIKENKKKIRKYKKVIQWIASKRELHRTQR